MIVNFDQVDFTINNIETGIISESVSVDYSNSVEPIYCLGKKNSVNQSPTGPIRAGISINYIPELNFEPSLEIIRDLRTGIPDHYTGVQLYLGGLIINEAYLESYTLRVGANDIARASVNFVSYKPISGNIEISSGNTFHPPVQTFGHGWSTYITSSGEAITDPIYNFEYSFNTQWEPIYILGKSVPEEVEFISASETMQIQKDIFTNIIFSGQNASGTLIPATGNDRNIDIMSILFICSGVNDSISINISGAKIKNGSINFSLDNIVRTDTTIQKFF